MATYVPYFNKNIDTMRKYNLTVYNEAAAEINKGKKDNELEEQLASSHKFPLNHSGEYGSTIIHSIETGTPSVIYANVKNTGLITNLQPGSCVEVPCLVDKEGIHPCYIGDLPPQLAALNRSNINVHELAVKGIVEGDRTKILQAILLDPLTGAAMTIDETRLMVDELFSR
jgi:alpha-galactosidase